MSVMKQHGFTLIELLTVILILSIVLTVVGPMYRGGQKSDVTVLGRKLAADLRYAKSIAITSGRPYSVMFDFEKKNYTLGESNTVHTIPDGVDMSLTLDVTNVNNKVGKIYFYPDGSSSGGVIELQGSKKIQKVITSWLHGGVSLEP